jgi:hypothetical protein
MALELEKYLDPVEPVEQVQEYVYEDIDLGGESWNYRILWNDRAERWSIDVYDSEEDDDQRRVNGTRLVPNWPINFNHTGRIPTNGFIMLLDAGDPAAAEPCTYEGFGHRWKLCWIADDGVDVEEDRPWSITVP